MSKPFKVGGIYKTKSGEPVQIVSDQDAEGPYWCVRGSDGIWRYNRPSDRGRVTASLFDMSCPKNLIPEPDEETP